MRARDLAQPYASIGADRDAATAVRLMIDGRLPGLLVADSEGLPYAILSGDQVVRAHLPFYVWEDPVLARVIDEPYADRIGQALAGRRIADCLPPGRPFLPAVAPDSTAIEVAELMARTRSHLVAVVERRGHGAPRLLGIITTARLLEQLHSGV
ncbi:CBS domain-containing protein [Streptomyces albicerus]|uniref:CBS domain-containing protein n=1 Tax=Streptomyces albicerus TaxID=2569859 RepID=UPI00124B7436|nr:CBS domain-containing protein [Streptomyces albicerus]